MKDRLFLGWLHERYGENENVDYMWKLRSIIDATPIDQETPNTSMYSAKNVADEMQDAYP